MSIKQALLVTVFFVLSTVLGAKVLAESTASYPFPSGSVVNDSGTVHFISGTIKIPFTNASAFLGLGYSFQNMLEGSLNNYTLALSYRITTSNAAHPWGSWLNAGGTVYYSIESGLIGVPSAEVFLSNGGDWRWVTIANSYDIQALRKNPNLALLTKNDSRVYTQNGTTTETCGNNVCESIEKSSGSCPKDCGTTPSATTSQVKTVNGKAKLYINGQEYNSPVTQVYNYASDPNPPFPKYGTSEWNERMKQLIDSEKKSGAGIVMPRIWWSDVEKTKGVFDFSSLDQVMDYAQKQGVYMMPVLNFEHDAPDWFRKENNFPPYNVGKICDFCETDWYGNVYQNPSMNSDAAHESYTRYLQAAINRYKNHSALAGWVTGIGPTAEDGYGPDYVEIKGLNPGGLGTIEKKPFMYTDYSPFFQREFKKWIKTKYTSNKELQSAWNDTSVTLDTVSIPDAKKLLLDPTQEIPQFPDAGYLVDNDTSKLSTKGMDFYEFRTKMETAERNYYANFFKTKDPNHVVIFNAMPNIETAGSKIDGFIGNFSLCFDCREADAFRKRQYSDLINTIKKAASQNKISTWALENGAAETGASESSGQIAYITAMGKAAICAGGVFGYVSDLGVNGAKLRPDWNSTASQNVIKEIENYTPDSNCECNIVKDLWQKFSCETTYSIGCGNIANDYSNLCKVSLPSLYSSTQSGSCGDGVCDAIEKSSGQCTADCK